MPVTFTDFNWVDLIFVILLLGMAYKGLKIGVGGQILSLIGCFILLFVSINYYNLISQALFGFILQKWAKPLSFFTIAVGIFVAIKLLEKWFHLTGDEESSVIEKIGGIVVGAFRAAILCGLVGILFLLLPVEYLHKSVTETSKSSMFFINMDAEIYSWMTGIIGIDKKREREDVLQEFLSGTSVEYRSIKAEK